MTVPSPREHIAHFRRAFPDDPKETFRQWFLLQEKLRDEGPGAPAEQARALAEDLWQMAPDLVFPGEPERAGFFHNLAVFLGSKGPAANLPRALEAFQIALGIWDPEQDGDDYARALHNRGNALQGLGTSPEELHEALTMYERALFWRNEKERGIARSVTLHHMGMLLRRLADDEPGRKNEHLMRSTDVLSEALALREREKLREGAAATSFQLALTLEASGLRSAAAHRMEEAARAYQSAGKAEEADLARHIAARLAGS
jgi:tetratricopeptide (TPR) repeat protein